MKRLVVAILVITCAPISAVAQSSEQEGDYTPVSVAIPRSSEYELRSRLNGRLYRIMVATPFGAHPDSAYPALYVLDGNANFATAAAAVARQALFGEIRPAIVIGIDYPTDDLNEVVRLRSYDFTPSVGPTGEADRFGGGDIFRRILSEEIRPFVESRYMIDPSHQILYGHSYAGLLALRQMFREPNAFSTYILSSPSIWFNGREILGDEDTFVRLITTARQPLSVLITSAGDEQYRGSDPRLIAADTRRMVDNASELAERLARVDQGVLRVARIVFEGETHISVTQASLSRSLRFSLAP